MTVDITKHIRIFLVDDHFVVRTGLRTLLQEESGFEVVGEADTIAKAAIGIQAANPDVILLDVRLPDGNGFKLCREVRKTNADAKIIMLTSYADNDIVYESMLAGADGYLLKEIDKEGLVRAIRDVADGKSILDPSITKAVLSRLKSGEGDPKGRMNTLSNQERRVLELVAAGKTNKEIAVDLGLSDKTVKNYLSNVLDKLKLSRRSQAAVYFTQHGH
ncbi:MAG: devR [Verrucomicrobiales bacterium]|jgi:two-component system response regulator DevR|nr:devR [Verrucomicrobiales bacterium]